MCLLSLGQELRLALDIAHHLRPHISHLNPTVRSILHLNSSPYYTSRYTPVPQFLFPSSSPSFGCERNFTRSPLKYNHIPAVPHQTWPSLVFLLNSNDETARIDSGARDSRPKQKSYVNYSQHRLQTYGGRNILSVGTQKSKRETRLTS